jgi:hypothetical protein
MKRIIPVFILIILVASCKKSESEFIWEKSLGKGSAYFIKTSSDSGFYACGNLDGSPYFVRYNKQRSQILELSSEYPGLFSSAWFDTSGYITVGSSAGKMLLVRYSPIGNRLWEKLVATGFYVDFTHLFYTGNGKLLAIASASPDSVNSGITNLYFSRFDTTGNIIVEKKTTESGFVSANKAVTDNAGNIFLPVTRKSSFSNPKASVAKYNDQFQKMWETELYNNPDFGAASLAINISSGSQIFVSGSTGVSGKDGILNNTFLASLNNNGTINWKKYLENNNAGSAMIFDNVNNLKILNRNCYIINFSGTDGTDEGLIRPFSICNSENTDAFGRDFSVFYDSNILIAGSLGGSFYLALKSSQVQ